MEEKQFNQEIKDALDQRSLATEGTQESSIDFGKIFKDILKHKKLYYKVLPITFVIAAFLLLSLPNYYKCEVKLSPEMSGGGSKSGLLGLASSFGVNLKGALGNSTEALFPTLYPDLMNSVDFKASLFEIPVTIEGDKITSEVDDSIIWTIDASADVPEARDGAATYFIMDQEGKQLIRRCIILGAALAVLLLIVILISSIRGHSAKKKAEKPRNGKKTLLRKGTNSSNERPYIQGLFLFLKKALESLIQYLYIF